MKLVCISGGRGAEAAKELCRGFGITFAETVLPCADPRAAKRLAKELTAHKAEAIICLGETGLAAGLFALKKMRKARSPVIALADCGSAHREELAKFDAILCADAETRAALLRTAVGAHKLHLCSDGIAAIETAVGRYRLCGRSEVVICGSNGLGNLGDEAMLTAILSSIRRASPLRRVTVLSRDPNQTRQLHKIDTLHSFALPALVCRLRKAKLFISGGGTLLTDLTSTRSLRYYLLMIRLAKLCGARVLLYSCGIGPFADPKNKKRTARVLNRCAEAIVVRDRGSLDELAAIGVTEPQLLCGRDAVFSLKPQDLNTAENGALAKKLHDLESCAVFALRPWTADAHTADVIRDTARRLWHERGLTPVFLAMEPPKDLPFAQTVADGLDIPHLVLEEVRSFAEAFSVISRASLVISMRLHALIAAGLANVPLVGISYDIKISGYLAHVGSPACVDYDTLSADRLIAQAQNALAAAHSYQPPPDRAGKARLQAMLTD